MAVVAKIYGSAVFDSVKQSGKLAEMYSDIEGLKGILADNPDLMKVFLHPDISLDEKQGLVEKIFKTKVINELYGLIQILLEKERIGSLSEVLDELIVLYKAEMGIGVVYVTTPSPLSEAQKKALNSKILSDTEYKSLEFHFEQDEKLIAGMVIRIGDRVVDSSVATRLEKMTRSLKTLQIK